MNSEFAIDHSKQLKKALESANSVLYLGENAGEIVFDKLFIQTINHPNLTYAVRGAPVINDADLIISKGQGNLEGLIPLNDDRVFFLLMVKCDVMAEFMKVKKDSFVVYNASC